MQRTRPTRTLQLSASVAVLAGLSLLAIEMFMPETAPLMVKAVVIGVAMILSMAALTIGILAVCDRRK